MAVGKGENRHISDKNPRPGTIVLSQQDYLPILADSFLIDRQSQGLSADTISFYRKKLRYFLSFYEGQAATQIAQITPDLMRRFMLGLPETHNGGVTCLLSTAQYTSRLDRARSGHTAPLRLLNTVAVRVG